jgi:hypothetical protein
MIFTFYTRADKQTFLFMIKRVWRSLEVVKSAVVLIKTIVSGEQWRKNQFRLSERKFKVMNTVPLQLTDKVVL